MIAVLQQDALERASAPNCATSNVQRSGGTWLQTLSHLDPKYGGLTAVVPAMAAELQRRAFASVRLAVFCTPDESVPTQTSGSVDTQVWPAGHAHWLFDASARRRFAQALKLVDGLHIHGLWDASTCVAASAARKQRKAYVVSAHGMLEPWALSQGATKKRIYGALVERPTLQRAAWLHALTSAEADDYRRFGCTGPIAIIPNAVKAPSEIDVNLLETLFPQTAGKRVVLFLGRLHVKKGVELLLQAWAALRGEHPNTVLVLSGPGEAEYVGALQARAIGLGIQNQVVFTGMLDVPAKWSALRRAHVFVLASYSEGLSVATLEALSAGTPVIVSESCHMAEVVDEDCGWLIRTDVGALTSALRNSLESSSTEQLARSGNARRLATSRYSWNAVGAQMAELYTCVLGGGRPSLSDYREAGR